MTRDEALALADELERFVQQPPGADPEGLRRVQDLVRRFDWDETASSYTREKAHQLAADLGYWLTARRWQQFGEEKLSAQMRIALQSLRSSIRDRPTPL